MSERRSVPRSAQHRAALAAEMDQFKEGINLTEFAASLGYRLDRRESSRNSAVMRHPAGDKIIVTRAQTGHWVYFSVRDEGDNGTIIDFAQRRGFPSLPDLRAQLRTWIGSSPIVQDVATWQRDVVPVTRDRAAVLRALAVMAVVSTHPYLERHRGIPAAVIADPRFAGRILRDHRGNAIFPHYDREGTYGYEIKNRRFTGFSRGGEKALWVSRTRADDTALVIAESAVDALSHAALFPDPGARYASFGGSMNPSQPPLIQSAIARLPIGATVMAATDNDPDGLAHAMRLEALYTAAGRPDLAFQRAIPEHAKDWNEVLMALRLVTPPA